MKHYRLALLGDPVDHSLSPRIHRELLSIAGLSGEYEAVRADPAVLAEEIAALRRGERHGLNVTMPLKRAAAAAADRLTGAARVAWSVNTLSLDGAEVLGDSTDAATFAFLFNDLRFSTTAALLLLGAGGSAAAALAASSGRPVYVASRRAEGAKTLTARLGGEVVGWGTPIVGAIVVNTTPLGMKGEHLPESVVAAASGLIDLPYRPGATPTVAGARAQGLPVADGHEFLLRQAVASFRTWTGVEVAYEQVSQRVRNA